MAGLPAPPQAPSVDSGVENVSTTNKERILGGIGGVLKAGGGYDNSPLQDAMAKQHNQRVIEATKHHKDFTTYTGILATGVNPDTGQPLTADDAERYHTLRESSWDAYQKVAGVNKDLKDRLKNVRLLADHIISTHPKVQDTPGAAPQGGGMPPPPGEKEFADAPRVQQKMDEEHEFGLWKRMQDVLRQNKIAENEALAKARQAGQRAPRPAGSMTTSVLDARKMAGTGRIYKGYDGDPIDLDSMDDSMGLKGMTVYNPTTNDWEVRYEPFSPNQATVTVGNETFAVSPMDKSKIVTGAGTDLGKHNAGGVSHHLDPVTGQTDTTTRTPNTPGVPGRGLPPPPTTGATPQATGPAIQESWDEVPFPQVPAPAAAGNRSSTPPASGGGRPTSSPSTGLPPLDEQGHIPNSYQGATPQVVEGANQLLDGSDKDKIPSKTRELSSRLARQYGWEQGRFTPKEQVQLREATTFLQQALHSSALTVLDEGAWQRFKTSQANKNPDKEGMVGQFASLLSAKGLTPKQAEFNRVVNQLVGTISGLSSLVRSNRATEAQVERLKSELFNAVTTKDSADAKQRIQRLLDEVKVAMKKGTFEGVDEGKPKSKGLPKPPGGAKSIDDEIMEAVHAGKPL